MSALTARRLRLAPDALAAMCRALALLPPPGFDVPSGSIGARGHPSVAAGLVATCAPRVGVLVTSTVGAVTAAFGLRDDLGGGFLRAVDSEVEVSAWPAVRLGEELSRAVPSLGCGAAFALHAPLTEVTDCAELRTAVRGTLRASVVAPPHVVGQVVWLATAEGWLSLEPAEVRRGVRWAFVRPVTPSELGAAVAPFVASALS